MPTEITSQLPAAPSNALQDAMLRVRRFQFGVFELDVSSGELRKQGLKLKLQEKPFQLLVLLLEHAGRITTREELRRGLWSADTFVNFEANLKTALNKLRQALGDSAESPIFIETVPRQGYRFVAPVVRVESESCAFESPIHVERPIPSRPVIPSDGASGSSRWRRPIARLRGRMLIAAVLGTALLAVAVVAFRAKFAPVQTPSAQRRLVLLVLPFENLSGDPSQQYFSDGMTDEMITLLGRQYPREVAVIARTSAMRYRGTQKPLPKIASELGGADYVLEGSVRRSGRHVAINAQLFRAQDQASLWAETYESELPDLLAVQQDVAGHIARSLLFELVPGRRPRAGPARNPQAYDDYLMGLYEANQRTQSSLLKSLDYFQAAIAADPSYAPPYAGLANSYLLCAGWLMMRPADAYPKAKAAALQALALDQNLAEAHTALAESEHEYEWKWAEAEQEFRLGIELDPNSAIAHKSYAEFLMHGGRSAEAIAEMERARDLDPLSLIVNTLVGFAYHNARQYDRAVEQYEKVIRLDPLFAPAHYFLGGALLQQGRYDEAIAHFGTARTLSAGASLMTAGLARAYALAGRRDSARHTIHQLQVSALRHYVSPYGLAQAYSALGDRDAAIKMLDRAAAEHSFELMFLRIDRSFENLKEELHFQQLLKRVGFPQPASPVEVLAKND